MTTGLPDWVVVIRGREFWPELPSGPSRGGRGDSGRFRDDLCR
jgi:hypothetical protein